MYAKYNINIWFIEFKHFNRSIAQAVKQFSMIIYISVIIFIKGVGCIFNMFISPPKVMRVNGHGKYEEVKNKSIVYPEIDYWR